MAVRIALSVGAVVGMCISAAYSAIFLLVPLLSRPDASLSTAAGLASIGLVGVAAGAIIIWSNWGDRHKGRWGWVGLALSLLYLGASIAPPIALVTLHWYGPVALALVALAVWNILSPISALSVGAVVGVCLSAAYSVLFLYGPLLSRPADLSAGAALASIGLIGVAGWSMIIWSDRHKGRRSWVAVALALLYLAASVYPPVQLATAHYHRPFALALVSLALLNMLWHILRPGLAGLTPRCRWR